ncbi:methyltransferase [Paenibacillus sp. 481]|uniref:methyltransferase n=1 Tax=Paenibacillus sp. 481 TaxID=2835869 RepID=UPI001E5E7B81|nr:methyltransferase [Paenibacillus sp. 481]UHA73086.1 methyltransferase [Paenibacillus sp. 481]
MSRSWERKVRKNSTQLNKKLSKQGKTMIQSPGDRFDEFKGRSIILPIVLIGFALIYAMLGAVAGVKESPLLYWVTVVCYGGLGLIFIFRRPFLRVSQDSLSTIRWNRLRTLQAEDMKKIVAQPGYIIVEHKNKGGNWVFSRAMNRYDTSAMSERLATFAQKHGIAFERVTK